MQRQVIIKHLGKGRMDQCLVHTIAGMFVALSERQAHFMREPFDHPAQRIFNGRRAAVLGCLGLQRHRHLLLHRAAIALRRAALLFAASMGCAAPQSGTDPTPVSLPPARGVEVRL